ncbi:uncharacterized protein N7477_001920 [Penicillium maclennaniae]|uniref:uncharacterized protein n=1 Tax=Penicillium maclennaniae TaxID=1343394 RepID=UPI00253FFF4B|nr:uncharacterized protein N7477_001920 [Penicillium maclennaniae]KAJ5681980.1 hypothetical protein N7477_001920 [Penicillium maclennaniae]
MATVEVGTRTKEELTLSRERVEPGSFNIPLGTFPQTCSETPEDPDRIATSVIDQLNSALGGKHTNTLSELFIENSYWRDHLCFSWDFRTLKGRDAIVKFVTGSSSAIKFEIDRSSAFKAPHNGPIDAYGEVHGIEFFVIVTSNVGHGQGVIRLAQQGTEWKIFTVFTSLEGLTGHSEAVNSSRPAGVQHGGQVGRTNWKERRIIDENFEEKQPSVLVVVTKGAGQGGLTIAARLKMLNIDTLVIDHEDRIGDSWRHRYHQLVLHDPVWFDHMPYIPFPPTWPIFTPKDKLADFFESYVKLLELNVWTRTELKSSSWDDTQREWTVVLERKKEDGTTETRTLHPHHVIQATGHSGKKNAPTFKGTENFKGDRICHSSEFPGASTKSAGKKAIVIGSCNSGHDIAQDFFEKGYQVTMVQRSSTCVVSSESITDISLKGLYEENGPPTEEADLYLWSIPLELFKTQQIKVTRAMNQNDEKDYRGPGESRRGGGYYIDMGASQLIIDGKIKGDEIVFATGYQNMRTQARLIFGDEVADRVGDVWGLDAEGEMRTIWRRSGHPGFWFMGGNLALCRYYSRLLALQIKALEVGAAKY